MKTITAEQLKTLRNLLHDLRFGGINRNREHYEKTLREITKRSRPRKTNTQFFLMEDLGLTKKVIVFRNNDTKGRTYWSDGDIGPLGFWQLHEMTGSAFFREVTREEALKTVKKLPL